jgi:hypothetical protein
VTSTSSRPKKGAEEVRSIEDVRRFFMVTAREEQEIIAKKIGCIGCLL